MMINIPVSFSDIAGWVADGWLLGLAYVIIAYLLMLGIESAAHRINAWLDRQIEKTFNFYEGRK